jgi:hypothetical protein
MNSLDNESSVRYTGVNSGGGYRGVAGKATVPLVIRS